MRPRYAFAWREAKLRRPAYRTRAEAHKGENAKLLREIVAPLYRPSASRRSTPTRDFHTSRRQMAGNTSHSSAESLRRHRCRDHRVRYPSRISLRHYAQVQEDAMSEDRKTRVGRRDFLPTGKGDHQVRNPYCTGRL